MAPEFLARDNHPCALRSKKAVWIKRDPHRWSIPQLGGVLASEILLQPSLIRVNRTVPRWALKPRKDLRVVAGEGGPGAVRRTGFN